MSLYHYRVIISVMNLFKKQDVLMTSGTIQLT